MKTLLAILLFPFSAIAQEYEIAWTFPGITMQDFVYDAMRINIEQRQDSDIAPIAGVLYFQSTGIGIPLWGSCIKSSAGYYCSASTQRGEIVFRTDSQGNSGAIAVAPSTSGKAMTLISLRPLNSP